MKAQFLPRFRKLRLASRQKIWWAEFVPKSDYGEGRAIRRIMAKVTVGQWDSKLTPVWHEVLQDVQERKIGVDSKEVKWAVNEAATANDSEFFARLGEAVTGQYRESESKRDSVDNVIWFLTSYWTEAESSWPPFCLFSDKALAQLCRIVHGRAIEVGSLKRLRLRLGLTRPTGIRKVRSVSTVNADTVLLG